uniref:Uncharacterized protein n=1 Tax=Burkholderia phage vB_BgluM-SURPRISE13 TaxID=3159457 RepID=A0AAU7PFD8_9VIRU
MKTRIAVCLLLMAASASAFADGPFYAYSVPDANGQPRQITADDWTRNADNRAEDPDNPMSDRARAFRNGWIQRGDYDAQHFAQQYDQQQQQQPQTPLQSQKYVYSDAPAPLPGYDPNQVAEVDADQPPPLPQQYAYAPPPEPPHLVRSPAPVYYAPPPPRMVQQYYGPTQVVIQPAVRPYPRGYPQGYVDPYVRPDYAYRQAQNYPQRPWRY